MNHCNKICVTKRTQKEFKGWKKYNLENPNEELLSLVIKIIRNTREIRKDKIYKSNIKILKFLIYHTKYVYKMYKKITKNLMFP